MKTNFLKSFAIAFTAGSLILSSCSKEESSSSTNNAESFKTTKQALFLYYTGSQCNPCGSAGIPNYESIINDVNNADKVIGVAVHTNAPAPDSLADVGNSGTAGADLIPLIISNNSYSAPTFLIPMNGGGSGSGSASTAKSTFAGYVNTLSSQSPAAAINVSASLSADGIYSVKTRTKFLKDDSSTYKMAVLILEDGVVFEQLANSKIVRPYTHNEVLRGKFSASAFGDEIKVGVVKNGDIIEKTTLGFVPKDNAATPVRNWNKKNLSAVVVLWKHTLVGTTNTVEAINCEKIKLP